MELSPGDVTENVKVEIQGKTGTPPDGQQGMLARLHAAWRQLHLVGPQHAELCLQVTSPSLSCFSGPRNKTATGLLRVLGLPILCAINSHKKGGHTNLSY